MSPSRPVKSARAAAQSEWPKDSSQSKSPVRLSAPRQVTRRVGGICNAKGAAFSKGRDFGAWLGLVPRQMSTGDRTILGRISKQGNRYLRALFVQAARVVLMKPQTWEAGSTGDAASMLPARSVARSG
jgi:transposase